MTAPGALRPRAEGSAKPRKSLLGPTLFTLFGVLLLLGLGTWQIERLHWKEGLIAARHAGTIAPPVPLPESLAAARPLAFRHVAVTGRFHNDHELYLYATLLDSDAVGYQVITPFTLADGATLLINRGFVPAERKAPATRAAGELSGEVTVTGLLRLPEKPGAFTPANDPAHDQWYSVDLPAMAKAAGVGPVLPFYVDADKTPNPGGWPRGGQTILDLPNNHLSYAATWYTLAVTLIVFYIKLVRRHRRPGETP